MQNIFTQLPPNTHRREKEKRIYSPTPLPTVKMSIEPICTINI